MLSDCRGSGLSFQGHAWGRVLGQDHLPPLRGLQRELVVVDRRRVSDADLASWRKHAEGVVEHTSLRSVCLAQGRLAGQDDALCPARLEEFLRGTCKTLLDLALAIGVCRGRSM